MTNGCFHYGQLFKYDNVGSDYPVPLIKLFTDWRRSYQCCPTLTSVTPLLIAARAAMMTPPYLLESGGDRPSTCAFNTVVNHKLCSLDLIHSLIRAIERLSVQVHLIFPSACKFPFVWPSSCPSASPSPPPGSSSWSTFSKLPGGSRTNTSSGSKFKKTSWPTPTRWLRRKPTGRRACRWKLRRPYRYRCR